MALTSKGLDTRARIIDGASQVLRDGDFGEILLDDVLALTNTSKGQLFHYFPGGKEELLLAVARHEADRVLADQQPPLGALTSWAAWERWRDSVVARYRAQGAHCPLSALMAQVGSTPDAFVIDFSFVQGPTGWLLARLMLSPQHAKRLSIALAETIAKHEERFGKIETGPTLQ